MKIGGEHAPMLGIFLGAIAFFCGWAGIQLYRSAREADDTEVEAASAAKIWLSVLLWIVAICAGMAAPAGLFGGL
jgi:hypothetical protein